MVLKTLVAGLALTSLAFAARPHHHHAASGGRKASAGGRQTSSSTSPASPSSTQSSSSGKVAYAGVNIAGCDFGCDINGSCSGSTCPTGVGPTQMQHFATADNFNIFRLPTGWQPLVNYNLDGGLDKTFFASYDGIVRSCLATGAKCIIDIHNYARWDGGIIGQGGPSNEQFANLWSALAKSYADEPNIVFGVMNEPHDLDMPTWATTVQQVVTAIRNAGAASQWILLPGTDFTSAGAFAANSGPALQAVTNPDGSTANLIYDVHQYFDADSSGTSTECTTDHVADTWSPLAAYLRGAGRQALVSELGGGNTASCEQYVCSALDALNANSDVYLGWVGWAAGSFDAATYALSEVPSANGQDTQLVQQCIAGKFR